MNRLGVLALLCPSKKSGSAFCGDMNAQLHVEIRGDGPDKIRELVRSFHAARPDSLPSWNPNLNPRLVEARADFYDDVRAGRKKAPRFKGTFVPTDHGDVPADKGMS